MNAEASISHAGITCSTDQDTTTETLLVCMPGLPQLHTHFQSTVTYTRTNSSVKISESPDTQSPRPSFRRITADEQ